jgi:type VI secretion system protein ImpM
MSAFLFGKLPAHGDFVSRGIAGEERQEVNIWLTSEMHGARRHHGESFDDSFDEAPPWRFAWSDAGVWTAGALAPSVDSVGRRFPILVGRRAVEASQVISLAEQCEACIYRAFGEALDAEALAGRLVALQGQETDVPEGDCWWTLGSGDFPEVGVRGRLPENLLVMALTKTRDIQ